MATKTVKVESKLGPKFEIESTAGGHKVIVDQPAAGGGTDAGPTPLDYLFVSFGGCIATLCRIISMQKRIPLNGVTVSVEGDINVDGLLGKKTDDPIGFKEIRVSIDLDADISAEEKEALAKEAEERCPVSWNLINASSVKVSAV